MAADREILFGLLALQNGLIGRDDLVTAFQILMKDKTQALAQILQRTTSGSPAEFEMLHRLVELHIIKHRQNPQESLASLSSLDAAIKELQQFDDADIRATLIGIARNSVSQHSAAESQDPEQTFVPGKRQTRTSGSSSGRSRFRILRPHARGGLGEVFVAQDEELNRDVALKEIQSQFADDPQSRSRFVLEAEVTGGLEHPGIVPVYGLGRYEDGRPYYAMRFIKGDSLTEAIDQFHSTRQRAHHSPHDAASAPVATAMPEVPVAEREDYHGLKFRKLLGRFVDVCQAVSYAHSRGVLHRDLKPGNIMLGKYGETLVVDWGLAKVRERDEVTSTADETTLRPTSGSGVTPTMMGSAIGTPGYMPPEQASGRLDLLGPASDVYSLGATLYHLLTGRPPFKGSDIGAVLQAVQAGSIALPRSIQPQIPPALSAICLKSMSVRPDDRYASPQYLADDIERFLADEPVSVCPEPLNVRVRRWMRHHPVIASTTAACVVMAFVSLSAFSAVVAGKNQQLAEANKNERLAREQAVVSEDLARRNAEAATTQSSLALSTMSSIITDLQGSLKDVAGGAAVRRQLLATVLPKLEQISTEFASKSAVDRSTMLALEELGDVVLQIGEAGQASNVSPVPERSSSATANKGRLQSSNQLYDMSATEAAGRLYERAHQIVQQLVVAAPDNPTILRDLSCSFGRLGMLARVQGNLPEAERLFREELRVTQSLVESDPTNAVWQQDLSACLGRLGSLARVQGNLPEADRLLRVDLHIAQRLAESDPANDELQNNLSVCYENLGDLATTQGNLPEAERLFSEDLSIMQRLAESDPANARWQRNLSVSFGRLGTLAMSQGNLTETAQFFREQLRISERLAESDPTKADWQRDLSISYEQLGILAVSQGNLAEAESQFGESLRIMQRLAESDPGNADWQRDLSVSFIRLGELATTQGNLPEAQRLFGESLRIIRRLAESDPNNSQWQFDLGISNERLGDLARAQSNLAEADRVLSERHAIIQRLAESDPDHAEWQNDLSISFIKLGGLAKSQGNLPEAERLFGESLRVAQGLVESDPTNAERQRNLSVVIGRLGVLAETQGNLPEAERLFREELRVTQRLVESDPTRADWQRDLAISYERLGDLALAQGDTLEAQRLFGEVLQINRRLTESDPTNAIWQRDLFFSYYSLGDLRQTAEEFPTAIEHYRMGAAILKRLINSEKNVDESRRLLSLLQGEIQKCELSVIALGDWDDLLIQSPEALPELLDIRAIQRAKKSLFIEAVQAASTLRQLDNSDSEHLYNAACVFSLSAASIKAKEGQELTVEQAAQRDEWINAALATLKQSIDKGWTDFAHMQQDTDLTILRKRPEFQALIPSATPQ